MSEMRIIDRTGDSKVIWDKDKPDEIEAARDTFDKLRKKGYAAYSVKKNGDKDELITEFDPKAEKLILAPRMVGG